MATWIATILTILACIVSIAINFTVVRVRVDNLTNRENELKSSLDSATRELNNAIAIIKAFAAEQAVINKFVTEMLSSMNMKLEMHSVAITEHTVAIALIREKLK